MTRIFIRDEYHCGQHHSSAEEYVSQFEATQLFGRTHEIGLLNQVWTAPQSRLCLLHGATGIGKTTLIHKWLHSLQKKHWHDAKAVFLWTFYPPDLAHAPQDPVAEFFHHALYWFGGEEALRCPNLLQGEHLAKLVQSHRTLLILDGLENLQFKNGSLANQLGDPRLNVLLERLATRNPGLCVAISRTPLEGHFNKADVLSHELGKLSVDAGAEYLSYKGVQADTDRLCQTALDYGQNPLTLGLLGSYLSVWHQGDWRQMEKIPVLMDQQTDGRQARRILVANATELYGKPGEAILYLLSMLYRPTHWETLEALLGKERHWSLFSNKHQDTYASLIGSFARLNQQKRYQTILQLRELGLLELSGRCFWLPQWVREAYQRQLRYDWPVAWKETNQRLMQYHATLPKTVEDLSKITPLSSTHKVAKVAEPVSVEAQPAITATMLTETMITTMIANLATDVIPESEPVAETITEASAPTLTRHDLDNMIDLMTHLKRYQNSLQILQIRTKKYQKHVKQLDKEVQSMHYPFAQTGTNSR